MTDEQALMLYFGQDIAQKAIIVASLRGQMNKIIEAVSVDKPKQAPPQSEEATNMEAEMMDETVDSFEEQITSNSHEEEESELEEVSSMKMPDKSPLAVDTRREPKAPEVKTSYKKGRKG